MFRRAKTTEAAPATFESFYEALLPQLKQYNVHSALDVIKVCMETVEKFKIPGHEKTEYIKRLLTELDLRDYLPAPVIDSIHIMIQNNLVEPTIQLVCQATQGKLNVNDAAMCCMSFTSLFLKHQANKPAPAPADTQA